MREMKKNMASLQEECDVWVMMTMIVNDDDDDNDSQ